MLTVQNQGESRPVHALDCYMMLPMNSFRQVRKPLVGVSCCLIRLATGTSLHPESTIANLWIYLLEAPSPQHKVYQILLCIVTLHAHTASSTSDRELARCQRRTRLHAPGVLVPAQLRRWLAQLQQRPARQGRQRSALDCCSRSHGGL